jgi:hypothetical protein
VLEVRHLRPHEGTSEATDRQMSRTEGLVEAREICLEGPCNAGPLARNRHRGSLIGLFKEALTVHSALTAKEAGPVRLEVQGPEKGLASHP